MYLYVNKYKVGSVIQSHQSMVERAQLTIIFYKYLFDYMGISGIPLSTNFSMLYVRTFIHK